MTKPEIFALPGTGNIRFALTCQFYNLTSNSFSDISQRATAWGQDESSKEGKISD